MRLKSHQVEKPIDVQVLWRQKHRDESADCQDVAQDLCTEVSFLQLIVKVAEHVQQNQLQEVRDRESI